MAQPTQAALVQQPNFERISQCHRDLSVGLEKCRNIPAFDSGNAILMAIQQLGERLDRIEARLQATGINSNQLGERLDRMEARQQAAEINGIARLQNSLLISPTASLTELHNAETNTPIDGFPATPRDIVRMNNVALNSVLRELDAKVGGSMEARRQRLRLTIGLKADPVYIGFRWNIILRRKPPVSLAS